MRRNESVFPDARFGKLIVIQKLPKDAKGYYRTRCRCDCGKETTPVTASIVNGTTKSCGCSSLAIPGFGFGLLVRSAVFHRWTVIKRVGVNHVKCLCRCGKIGYPAAGALIEGRSKSCGCWSSEVTATRNKTTAKFNGFSKKYPNTHSRWNGMMSRCYNEKSHTHADYGAKGVVVCQFLRKSPRNFMQVVGPWKKAKPSLDRYPIHDGCYSCGQCEECKQNGWKLNIRWATRKQQSENRGDFNVWIEAFGKRMLKSQWMSASGLSWAALTGRLRRGWDVERTLTTPDKKGNCYRP